MLSPPSLLTRSPAVHPHLSHRYKAFNKNRALLLIDWNQTVRDWEVAVETYPARLTGWTKARETYNEAIKSREFASATSVTCTITGTGIATSKPGCASTDEFCLADGTCSREGPECDPGNKTMVCKSCETNGTPDPTDLPSSCGWDGFSRDTAVTSAIETAVGGTVSAKAGDVILFGSSISNEYLIIGPFKATEEVPCTPETFDVSPGWPAVPEPGCNVGEKCVESQCVPASDAREMSGLCVPESLFDLHEPVLNPEPVRISCSHNQPYCQVRVLDRFVSEWVDRHELLDFRWININWLKYMLANARVTEAVLQGLLEAKAAPDRDFFTRWGLTSATDRMQVQKAVVAERKTRTDRRAARDALIGLSCRTVKSKWNFDGSVFKAASANAPLFSRPILTKTSACRVELVLTKDGVPVAPADSAAISVSGLNILTDGETTQARPAMAARTAFYAGTSGVTGWESIPFTIGENGRVRADMSMFKANQAVQVRVQSGTLVLGATAFTTVGCVDAPMPDESTNGGPKPEKPSQTAPEAPEEMTEPPSPKRAREEVSLEAPEDLAWPSTTDLRLVYVQGSPAQILFNPNNETDFRAAAGALAILKSYEREMAVQTNGIGDIALEIQSYQREMKERQKSVEALAIDEVADQLLALGVVGGQPVARMMGKTIRPKAAAAATSTMKADTWASLGFVYDGPARTVRLFLDSVEVGSQAGVDPLDSRLSSYRLFMGSASGLGPIPAAGDTEFVEVAAATRSRRAQVAIDAGAPGGGGANAEDGESNESIGDATKRLLDPIKDRPKSTLTTGAIVSMPSLWDKGLSGEDFEKHQKNVLTGEEKGVIGMWGHDIEDSTLFYDRSPNRWHGRIWGKYKWENEPTLKQVIALKYQDAATNCAFHQGLILPFYFRQACNLTIDNVYHPGSETDANVEIKKGVVSMYVLCVLSRPPSYRQWWGMSFDKYFSVKLSCVCV